MAVQETPRSYPTDEDLKEARDIIKPPGLLSHNYNKCRLKKVERTYVSAKDFSSTEEKERMYQTDYRGNTEPLTNSKYFTVPTQRFPQSTYDRVNHVVKGYNQKLHRDDREHAKSYGLKLHNEEKQRYVPLTSNANYGHPKLLHLERNREKHSRVEICKQDFYRDSGVNTKQMEE